MARAESRDTGFCALETYPYPHTILLKRGATRPHAPVEKGVAIERHSAFQHVIVRPGQLMRQDREDLALPVFFLSTGQILLARRMVAEAQDRRFGEGPLEVRMPDLRAGGAITLACRLLRAFD
jgi:hypothetical protein